MTDREILRGLAGQIAEIAHLPAQDETRALYRALNGLRPVRPAVLVDELPWNQLNAEGELTLTCGDPLFLSAEDQMRKQLYRWNHCRGDLLIDPFYALGRTVHVGGIGLKVVEDTLAADKGNHIVAHHYHDQLADHSALDKLRVPTVEVDDADTEMKRVKLDAAFGDILPIQLMGVRHANGFAPWDFLSMIRGVEPLLTSLYDEPEFMHAFLRKYTDIHLALLDVYERENLIEPYQPVIHCTPGLTDELPGDIPGGRVTRKNIWGRGTAQIFASVSPAMHDEFDIQYEREYFAGFGLVYYGCCEPLHDKMDIVKKLPNLRKISVTPWADVNISAEQMGRDCVLSRKPNPASVAVPYLDEELLRADILETLDACKRNNTPCEFILKDISSACYNPNNLTRWAEVVMETIRNY